MPPYNEPALASLAPPTKPTKGSARGGRAPRTAPCRPATAEQDQLPGQGPAGGVQGGDCGVLRYLQLTAVPSRPGGRAEEDPRAGVQVVLVVNGQEDEFDRLVEQQQLQQQRARGRGRGQQGRAGEGSGGGGDGDGGRLAAVLRLCERLWEVAGPGGPMRPAGAASSSAPSSSSTPSPVVGTPSVDDWEAEADSVACLLSPYQPSNQPASPTSSTPAPPAGQTSNAAPSAPLVHSIWLNFQPDACRNAILGGTWRHVAGPAAAWQDFGGVAACVGPGSFVQANYGAMQLVLRDIADMVG